MATKTCPFCAGVIQREAIVCKHCRRDLPQQSDAQALLMDMPGAYVCTVCQHVGQPKLVLKGSAWVAFFLLLLWLVPGIIYIIWAITNRRKCCEMCSSVNIVPANSVTGRRLLARAMKEDRE